MNRLIYIINSFVFVAFTFFLSSCINEDYTGQTAYGDAFIKSVQLDETTVGYNLQLYAYSWSEMKNVTAYSETDATFIPLDTIDYKYTFVYRPEETIYLPQPPVADKYYFLITFDNGVESVVNDYLNSTYILPPQIKALEWDNVDKQIKLEWYPVENAQIYRVSLLSESGSNVFETEMLDSTITEKWINKFTYGWHTIYKPTVTTTYKIVISAYLFEPIASTFDIQCIAINDLNSIEWELDE